MTRRFSLPMMGALVALAMTLGGCNWFEPSEAELTLRAEIQHLRMESAVMEGQGYKADAFRPTVYSLRQEIIYHAALIKAGGDLDDPTAVAILQFVQNTEIKEAVESLRLLSGLLRVEGCGTEGFKPTIYSISQEARYVVALATSKKECGDYVVAFPPINSNN